MKPYDKNKNYCTDFIGNIGKCIWNFCCYGHDVCYSKSGIPRIVCDRLFKICVKNKNCFWAKVLAPIMYVFVRTFGKSHYDRRRVIEKIKKFREDQHANLHRRKQH